MAKIGRLVKNIGKSMQLPKDVTAIQTSIIKAEYKPILVSTGSEDEPFEVQYIPSPGIGELLSLRQVIENISAKLSPPNQCVCALTVETLKNRKYAIEEGDIYEDNTRGESLDMLRARVASNENVYNKVLENAALADSEYAKDVYEMYLDARRTLDYKEEALKSIVKQLKTYSDYEAPPANMRLSETYVCAHCKSEIAHPLQSILFDEDLYDALSDAILGCSLEEAKQHIPISQIKYLWVHTVNWVFNLPEDLPQSFLSQAQNAMGMTNLGEPVRKVIGLAERMEKQQAAESQES